MSALLRPVSIPETAESIIFWISAALAPVSAGTAALTASETKLAISEAEGPAGAAGVVSSAPPQATAPPMTITDKSAIQNTPLRLNKFIIHTSLDILRVLNLGSLHVNITSVNILSIDLIDLINHISPSKIRN